MWHCFVRFCNEMYAEVVLPDLLEEPHHPALNFPKGSFGQKKPVHCSSFQGKWFSSRLSGVGFIMMKHIMQLSVLYGIISMCLWYTLHDLTYS